MMYLKGRGTQKKWGGTDTSSKKNPLGLQQKTDEYKFIFECFKEMISGFNTF